MVQELEMAQIVTCLRDVGQLRSLIHQTDLLVLPSHTMPMRSVFLEAMLCHVPVVATSRLQGFDMLIDEETACIARSQWDQSLNSVLQTPEVAQRIGYAGAKLIAEKYSSSAQIDAFEAALSLT